MYLSVEVLRNALSEALNVEPTKVEEVLKKGLPELINVVYDTEMYLMNVAYALWETLLSLTEERLEVEANIDLPDYKNNYIRVIGKVEVGKFDVKVVVAEWHAKWCQILDEDKSLEDLVDWLTEAIERYRKVKEVIKRGLNEV